MARKLRVQYPGAIYHVMSRGDRREAIFADDHDRKRFLDTLAERGQFLTSTTGLTEGRNGMGSRRYPSLGTPRPEAHLATS